MNPQQQPPGQPQPGSEYDFFLAPAQQPKQNPLTKLSGNGGGSSSIAVRVAIVAILAFVVIIFVYFILTLVGGSDSNKPHLITVAQDQNELIRVSTLATTDGQGQSSQATQNFAESAILSLGTEQHQLLSFMSSHGGQPSTAQLAATKNTNSDTELQNSIQASNFDATFNNIMQTQLKSYEADLQTAFQGAQNSTEKQLLSDDFDAAKLLLQQLTSPTE